MKHKKEIVTEEGVTLKFEERERQPITIGFTAEVMEALTKKAHERELSVEGLLLFYVGQGLRQDLSDEEAKDLMLKKLHAFRSSSGTDKNLAA